MVSATGAPRVSARRGQRRGGLDGAAAGQDQRALGGGEPLAHLRDRHWRRSGTRHADGGGAEQRVGVFHQHIQRDFDVYRARAPCLEQRKRPRQHAGQFCCRHHGVGERCHAGDQRTLVRQFMQLAAPAAQLAARLHAGDHQHRDRVGIGLAHGRGDVGHAGAGDDQTHAGLATGARIAIGHKTRALFVARGDVADVRTRQAAIQLHGVDARNTKHLVHAVAFQELDQYFAAGRHTCRSQVEVRRYWTGWPVAATIDKKSY
jgi:hypothetical protein